MMMMMVMVCILCSSFCSFHPAHSADKAVIYGNSLDAFTAVEKLLALGIAGSRLHLVLTPPSVPGTSCFSDPAIEVAVLDALSWTDVRMHHNLFLLHINDGEEEPVDLLTSVTFSGSKGEELRLECGVSEPPEALIG